MRTMINTMILLMVWAGHTINFSGCINHMPGTPQDSTDVSPIIVWRVPHGKNPGDQIAYNPEIYNNKLIFGYQNSVTEGYQIIDKYEGTTIQFIDNEASFLGNWTSQMIGSNYASIVGTDFRIIDLGSNDIIKNKIEFGSIMQNFVVNGNDVYFGIRGPSSRANLNNNQFKIVKNNVMEHQWKDVLNDSFIEKDSILGSIVRSFLIKNDLNGDKLIFYPAAQGFWNVNSKDLKKVSAYNLTKKTKMWETNEFSDSLGADGLNVFTPINHNGLIIVGFSTFLYAFDEFTGKEIWRRYLVDGSQSDLKLHNGKLTIVNSMGLMNLIDASTGAVLKTTQLKSGNTKQWQMHNGVIYFTVAAHTLYAIDADTHEIKWEAKSPNPNCGYCTFGFASPVVDAETNRLYISDRKEIICYELPW